MQLNSSDSGSGLQSEINITPLVDVVLVLLIIFMVVVPLLMQGYNVDIPRTSAQHATAQAAESRLILSIAPTGCRILQPPAGEGLPADCQVILPIKRFSQRNCPPAWRRFWAVNPRKSVCCSLTPTTG